jgi:hypothetical protein
LAGACCDRQNRQCAVKRHHDVISIDRAKLGDEIPTRAVAEVQVFVLRLTRSLRLTTLSSSIESPEVRIEKFGGRFDLIKPDRASRQANRDPCLLADARPDTTCFNTIPSLVRHDRRPASTTSGIISNQRQGSPRIVSEWFRSVFCATSLRVEEAGAISGFEIVNTLGAPDELLSYRNCIRCES